ncbi:hypothetical protein Chor_014459 [Crotalus horridus]
MNSLVALVLLGQIIGCTFSHHLQSQVDCNGEDAEKWADMAVHYINEHNLHGYKYTNNVINEIHVLPRAVGGDCDVKIIHDEGVDKVIGAKCHSDPDSVEEVRRNCPECPILLSLSDPHVINCVEYVLNKYNEKLSGHVYEVLEISRGQHKYEPEAFYVEFAIVEVNCTAEEAHDDHHHCHPNTDGENEGHAHSHLIEHHVGKYSTSPGHNNTVLNLIHSHNHTSASHESHSHEHMTEVPVAVAKREVPTDVPHDHIHPVKLCPGKVHHFKL